MTKIELVAKIALMNKAEVKTLKTNAEKRGETEVVKACVQRLAELGAPVESHPLVRRFWETITASEELQGLRHSRVRQMFARRRAAGATAVETVKEILTKT
jgi:hypothetical protein